jgi:hypothetical protein
LQLDCSIDFSDNLKRCEGEEGEQERRKALFDELDGQHDEQEGDLEL